MLAGFCCASLTAPQCIPAKRLNDMDKSYPLSSLLPDLLVDTSLAKYENCYVFDHGVKMRGQVVPRIEQALQHNISDHEPSSSGDSGFEDGCNPGPSSSGDSGLEDGCNPKSDNMSDNRNRRNDKLALDGSTQDRTVSNTVTRPPLVPTFDWTPSKQLVVNLPPVAPRQRSPQKQLQAPFSETVHTNPFRVSPEVLNSNPFMTTQENTFLDNNPFRRPESPVSWPTNNPFLDNNISPAVPHHVSTTNPFFVPSIFTADSCTRREVVESPVAVTERSPADIQREHCTLSRASRHLKMCGFFYPSMDMHEAKQELRDYAEGTFLVRKSSQPNYIYSISAKTCRGTTSVRVEYSNGRFRLDTESPSRTHFPSFDCVIKLLQFYVKVSTGGKVRVCVYAETSGRRDTPVIFETPLRKGVATLGHLARRTINKHVARGNIEDLPLPRKSTSFLQEYPFWL